MPALRLSIRSVLLFGFGGLLVTALSITLFLGFTAATRNTFSLFASSAKTIVKNTTYIILDDLEQVEDQSKWIGEALSSGYITIENQQALQDFLVGSLAATPDLASIGLVDENLNLYQLSKKFLTLKVAKMNPQDFNIMRIKEQINEYTGGFWDKPFWLHDSQETVINYRTVVPLPNNKRVMIGQLKTIENLSKSLLHNHVSDEGVPFVIYDGDFVLAHPNLANGIFKATATSPLPRLDQVNDPILKEFASRDVLIWQGFTLGSDIKMALKKVENQEYIFLYQELIGIMDKPLTIGVRLSRTTGDQEMVRLYISSAIAGVTVIISLIILLVMARKLARPIRKLAFASQKIASNQLENTPYLKGSHIVEFDQAAHAFNDMVQGLQEREKIRGLFGKMVPEGVAEAMLNSSGSLKPQSVQGTVLFCDLEAFTSLSEKLEPETIVELLNSFFTDMVEIIEAHGGIITQFQGDAILAVFNVPLPDPDHASKAVQAGNAMLNCVKTKRYLGHLLKCRIGINTGPMVAGNVGAESRMNYTVHGDAVNIAARLESMNKQFNTYILISETTQNLAPNFNYKKLDEMRIRGKEKSLDLFTMED